MFQTHICCSSSDWLPLFLCYSQHHFVCLSIPITFTLFIHVLLVHTYWQRNVSSFAAVACIRNVVAMHELAHRYYRITSNNILWKHKRTGEQNRGYMISAFFSPSMCNMSSHSKHHPISKSRAKKRKSRVCRNTIFSAKNLLRSTHLLKLITCSTVMMRKERMK